VAAELALLPPIVEKYPSAEIVQAVAPDIDDQLPLKQGLYPAQPELQLIVDPVDVVA